MIDASMVRLLLVPASMTLLGGRPGGCPAGWTGWLPHLDAEG